MDIVAPILIDAPAAFVVGSVIDAMSQEVGGLLTGPDREGKSDDITTTALQVVKLGIQTFTSISIMAKYSELMYSGTDSTDPTNGFLMLAVMLQASPHWRTEVGKLTASFQEYVKNTFLMPHNVTVDHRAANK